MDGHHHEHHHSQDAYDHVLDHLRNKHVRLTETRKAIIRYMVDSHEHPSAEKIYRDLLPKHPSMSLATVYNNLKVLVDEGFVAELKLSNDPTAYFDFIGHQHVHVVCEICGQITDFMDVDLTDVHKAAEKQTGYKITRTQLMMYGICPTCQEKH